MAKQSTKVSATGVNLGDAELNYTANGGAKQKVKLSEGLNFVDGNYTLKLPLMQMVLLNTT